MASLSTLLLMKSVFFQKMSPSYVCDVCVCKCVCACVCTCSCICACVNMCVYVCVCVRVCVSPSLIRVACTNTGVWFSTGALAAYQQLHHWRKGCLPLLQSSQTVNSPYGEGGASWAPPVSVTEVGRSYLVPIPTAPVTWALILLLSLVSTFSLSVKAWLIWLLH